MTLLTVIWSMIASACFTLAALCLHGWWGKRRMRELREQVDASIRQAEEFSQSVLASLGSHIAILDHEGMIIAVNQAWEKFAQANDCVSSAVGVGCSYLDVCRGAASTGESTARHAFEGVRSVLDGSSEFFEMNYPCHSPVEFRWFLMRVVPLRIPSGGAVVTHVDISQLRRAEQEAEGLRRDLEHAGRVALLGEMSGSLAHELNQPLEAILANAQAARRWLAAPLPDLDEIRLIIEDIIRDDKRAGEIVHSVRALVKKDVPKHQLMDVNRMVRETSSLLSRELLAAEVPLVLDLQPDLPLVEAGVVELQQALLNLMLNGLQAQGAVQRSSRGLSVSTRDAGDRLILAVCDQGPGLSPDITEHIFDAFFTTKSGGLGLGLSLCRHIAESHGGKLSAENHSEGGAVFSISLPVKEHTSS